MLKKIVFLFVIGVAFFSFGDSFANEACKQDGNIGNVGSALEDCITGSSVIQSDKLLVEKGFKEIILNFIKNISVILALAAIGFIAYGSIVLVASGGNDEKIKKGKNIIKWSLVGFLGLVSASGIIALLVNLIYGL